MAAVYPQRLAAVVLSRSAVNSRPTALVTGASSGIGEALARCFAGAGHDLVLVARSADKLHALAETLIAAHGIEVLVLPADLSRPRACAQLVTALNRKKLSIDVLVNNAGVLEQGAFVRMGAAAHTRMIDLNIAGLTGLLSRLLPAMVARGSGRVLNVASIAAFQPIPMLATYAATKAYVLSLTESLAEELRDTGVTITALCPGITATAMLSGAARANDQLNKLPGFLIGGVDEVAREGFEACMRGQVICVPGAVNRAGVLASRAAPKWLVRRIGGLMGRAGL